MYRFVMVSRGEGECKNYSCETEKQRWAFRVASFVAVAVTAFT